MYKTTMDSPLGMITLVSDGINLVGLAIKGQESIDKTLKEKVVENDRLPLFELTKKWLERYFKGQTPKISEIPLAPIGGEFRQTVWQMLCEIPYGEVVTYGDIAKRIALKMNKPKMSSQAIGGAVGHNPISIIIPCHRVVGANGNLTGYAGGIDLKIKLLELENVETTKFYVPSKP
ncbi:MAG: methylated-DNA--[protein]-cysteine S-methyltransferase [Erysipelotrichia bacterium]|nr:methylated-DNA--[protein]-cysteine S-methyltransferase [Erysipelotrichia bacterium]